MLAGCLVLLLHGAAAYGLMQIKGYNRPQAPVHIVQAALLPVVEAVAVQAAEPKPVEKKLVRKPKPRVKPPERKKKRRKKVRRKVVRKQPPLPEPQAVPAQIPETVIVPQLMASAAQHISAEAVYVPPQPEAVATAAPQIVAEESDASTDADSGKAGDIPAGDTGRSGAAQILTGSISQADYLSNPKPAYPSASRRLGEQGTVRLEVLVSVRGTAQRVRILKSSGHPRLDRVAKNTVESSWRFTPKRVNGQAVAQRVRFNMPFVLN